MTDGWGGRAIKQHKLIPPLHNAETGSRRICRFSKRDSPPSVLCAQGNAESTNRILGEDCDLLETIDFEITYCY